jgi:hypothetical protein
VDAAGNAETAKSVTVRIDTSKPIVKAPRASRARRGGTTTLSYQVTDAQPCAGKASVTIMIKNRSRRTVMILRLGERRAKAALQRAQLKIPRAWKAGVYRFYVYATDVAGNRQVKVASNKLLVR